MNTIYKFIQVVVTISWFLMTGCSSEKIEPIAVDGIKAEVVGGKVTTKFIYNEKRKIAESEGLYVYTAYFYDNNDRLIKVQSAADHSALVSSISIPERTELMTSKTAPISSFSIFHYGGDGLLTEIEHFFDKGNGFERTSSNSFEYDGEMIVRKNLHNDLGVITQFYVYQYDHQGNVIAKTYYSFLFSQNQGPHIISENFYEYDDKKNPFRFFSELGNPGLYTNTNNIVKVHTINHHDAPGIPEETITATSYDYNSDDYPVKVIRETDEYEYRY